MANPTDETTQSTHSPDAAVPLDRLVAIMARLRDKDHGCPWDIEQDFSTIAPYTIEEAYEVADAIARDDMAALKDELGDLLLQVVFHSRMAEEAGHFTVADVIASISDKMVRRHPHIFADQSVESWDWEAIKAAERSDGGAESAMDGVAVALPALMRAQKLQKRAARTGFDWPDVMGAVEKIGEEIEELLNAETEADRAEEAGDLLFAAVNTVRHMGVTAEDALRAANAKFERRFRMMEALAGQGFADLSLEDKEALWQRAKRGEGAL
ncbi:nucleoside triphosphate pyrophosphohydrolase [Blastomonas sp. SL216]|uniref:nucleoside triphosphate pyrophosphohydrolase n=1 Tax=Blastomonas sp. SL216 TaxID=2995169 RepID=UPI0023774DF3|nr:nucleoside triphosphate pyrophosphohydrolase [Blastomonas sp. SL216]